MIPKNTKIVTKEMIRQLEIEQTEVLKELQRHYSRVNNINFLRSGKKVITVTKRKFGKIFLGVFP